MNKILKNEQVSEQKVVVGGWRLAERSWGSFIEMARWAGKVRGLVRGPLRTQVPIPRIFMVEGKNRLP